MEHKFEWMLVKARTAIMAQRLREADKSKRGWQKEIAEELGVSKQYVSQAYKKYEEEQNMGGRGGGSGRGGGAAGGGGSAERKIDKTPFKDEGGGTYAMDIEGVGGGQINGGPDYSGMMVYEANVWDSNYEKLGKVKYGTLNAAKQYIKDTLKKNIGGNT